MKIILGIDHRKKELGGRQRWHWILPALVFGLVMAGWLIGCGNQNDVDQLEARDAEAENANEDIWKRSQKELEESSAADIIDEVMKKTKELVAAMSLEEKAGQVIMPAFRQTADGKPILRLDESTRDTLLEIQPAGVILFSENIDHNSQVKSLIEALQANATVPLLVSVDEEGGRVSRLGAKGISVPRLPAAGVFGESGDAKMVYEAGLELGKAMKMLGFNMNMSPVADVNTNPLNPVIGDRSFGSDPVEVGRLTVSMANGLMDAGILPVLKHFPGHGDTHQDTHRGAVNLPHDQERLASVELIPFRRGIEAGLPAIMTAHLHVPAYDNAFPATLSPAVLTGLLREKLGFEGVIMTDALDMQAITDDWSTEEAVILALAAGADLLLMPPEPLVARDAIVTAVTNGELPQERLDVAVERVLLLKWKAGLIN
ncbi:glycoside hydrolase family 3 protein [Anoxynatronum sibiricum]|uniref:beta-N-acetylhexosaminidase n=1 Tax=Anoxynatronum sibiricum TaxID=210623 RepID=A0ABU9VR12_9CLOT